MPELVEIATLDWASFQDTEGNALPGLTPPLTDLEGGSVELYDEDGSSFSGTFETGTDGLLPSYMVPGTYRMQEPQDGTWRQVEVPKGTRGGIVVKHSPPAATNYPEGNLIVEYTDDTETEWVALHVVRTRTEA